MRHQSPPPAKPIVAAMSTLIALILVWVGLIVGWISNIVWLFTQADTASSTEFWIALVGVVAAPLGIIHGWIILF